MSHSGDPSSLLASGLLRRNTLLNLLGQALPLVVALISIPPLISRVGTDRFGLLIIAWVVLGYFSLLDLGIGRSLTQLVAERMGEDRERMGSLIQTGLLLLLAVGIAGGGILLLLAPFLARTLVNVSPALQGETLASFRLLGLAVPFVVLTAGLRGLLEAFQRFEWVNALRVPQGILTYLAPLAVTPFSIGLQALVASLFVVRLLAWLGHGILVLRMFPELVSRPVLEKEELRDLFRLGGWITVSNVVGPLIVYLDRVVIGAVLSSSAVAYYATPFEVVSRLWIIPGAVVAVFFPAFATSSRSAPDRTSALFDDSARIILLLVFPLAFLLMALAPETLELWVGEEFAIQGSPVARWLLVGVLINAVAHVPFSFLQGVGRPDVTARLHLLEAPFYFLLLWVSLRSWGIAGAAAAWTVRATLDAILLFWLSYRVFPRTLNATRPLLGWLGAGVLVLALSAVPVGNPLLRGFFLLALLILAIWTAWRNLLPRDFRPGMGAS